MKTRVALALTALAGVALSAQAQELVTFNWSWGEVVAGTTNPVAVSNGQVDPGEGAELRLNVSFTPAVGDPITYEPFPPGTGNGFVGGLASIFIDIEMTGGFNGGFSNGRRAPGLTTGSHGTLDGNILKAVQAGQIAFPETPLANSNNPINNTWRIVWTPASYEQRTVTFTARKAEASTGTGAALYIRYGGTPEEPLWVSKQIAGNFGSWQIPVVPSPSSLALLGLGGLVAARRRR